MSYVIRKGTKSRLVLVYALDAADGRPGKTGLRPTMPGASAAYFRAGEAGPQRIQLVLSRVGEYLPDGWAEVDAQLMPGIYQLGLPDAALEGGADSVVVCVRFPGAVIEPIEISLVAYDPQDASRMGMSALGPEGRIAALRGAFPRVAATELNEMRAKLEGSKDG